MGAVVARPEIELAVGIDVSADVLHVVAITLRTNTVAFAELVDPDDPEALLGVCAGGVVAIDAPDRPSTSLHVDDAAVGRKFRSGRCAEVALGREFRYWVPWVTPPPDGPVAGWMAAGFRAWELLRTHGSEPIEVYPHAIFRALAGGRNLPKKTTAAGRRERWRILERELTLPPFPAAWGHDALDALAAALVAGQHHAGRARGVRCTAEGHRDGSSIWLPAEP
jgi:predicted nuclease with RNAse H fold